MGFGVEAGLGTEDDVGVRVGHLKDRLGRRIDLLVRVRVRLRARVRVRGRSVDLLQRCGAGAGVGRVCVKGWLG